MSGAKPVPMGSIIEAIQAAHLSFCVNSPFQQRGGIMLVSPPGQLKTSILDIVSDMFPNMLLLSDLNSNNLTAMHENLFSGRYRTIAFKDMIKLYERNPATSANLEGTLRSMVEEGWSGATAKDMRIAAAPVRILVMGAMTPTIYAKHYPQWIDTGFARRFLWCHYKLDKPELIGDAIELQKLYTLKSTTMPVPQKDNITFELDKRETSEIRRMLKHQQGMDGTPFSLMLKIAAVLKWKYKMENHGKKTTDHMAVVRDFGRLLQNEYVKVEI